jgi:hypothetical protein
MNELQPEVLAGLPDYRPVEPGFYYLRDLRRSWENGIGKKLGTRSCDYVKNEFAAAAMFTSLCARAGVKYDERAPVDPLWQTEGITAEPPIEQRSVTYQPLPVIDPEYPGRFAVLRQVQYWAGDEACRRARGIQFVAAVFQRTAIPDRPYEFIERFVRSDIQFIDCWTGGVRGTPFYASGDPDHLQFQEILKCCSPGARDGLKLKQHSQVSYINLLHQLVAQPTLREMGLAPPFDYRPVLNENGPLLS